MDILQYIQNAEEPWVRYRTLLDLPLKKPDEASVLSAKKALLAHPLIQKLLSEVSTWPGIVLASHKSAGQLFHKMAFLADLGLTEEDGPLGDIFGKIKENRTPEGLYPLAMNLSKDQTGETKLAWALCDAPILQYIVAKMTKNGIAETKEGTRFLMGLSRQNGWPCAVSEALGNWHGPGKREDPCPYATLSMLKLALLYPDLKASPEVKNGVECLLNLWENSRTQHPYIFYMGNDFRKLKLPFIWYDLLHVVEVLSQFDFIHQDARFLSMIKEIDNRQDETGLFTPEAVWTAWKDFDFGQKKKPSPWMTFVIRRIHARLVPQKN